MYSKFAKLVETFTCNSLGIKLKMMLDISYAGHKVVEKIIPRITINKVVETIIQIKESTQFKRKKLYICT